MDQNGLPSRSSFSQVSRYLFWTSRDCHELGSEDLLGTVGFGLRAISHGVSRLEVVVALEVGRAGFRGGGFSMLKGCDAGRTQVPCLEPVLSRSSVFIWGLVPFLKASSYLLVVHGTASRKLVRHHWQVVVVCGDLLFLRSCWGDVLI